MATFSLGESIKVQAAASGGLGLGAADWASVSYTNTIKNTGPLDIVTMSYGPGQTISGTIVINGNTYTLYSGVVFRNSP